MTSASAVTIIASTTVVIACEKRMYNRYAKNSFATASREKTTAATRAIVGDIIATRGGAFGLCAYWIHAAAMNATPMTPSHNPVSKLYRQHRSTCAPRTRARRMVPWKTISDSAVTQGSSTQAKQGVAVRANASSPRRSQTVWKNATLGATG